MLRQLLFFCVALPLGVTIQALLFKTDTNTWAQALTEWQGLWVVYFLVGWIIAERIMRRLPPKLYRNPSSPKQRNKN